MKRRDFIRGSAAVGGSHLLANSALSQLAAYPSRPIRFVVPYSAGGPTDIAARAIAQKLSDALGQQVVVDNRPGANEIIGADHVAKAAPDGYTLLLATDAGLSLNKHLYARLPYDPEKDFAPVTRIADAQLVLIASDRIKTVQDLIAKAKASPGAASYASAGTGNTAHLAMESFARLNALQLTHVPYKGAAAAFPDLMAGRVDAMFTAVTAALPLVQQGKVRALGMSGQKRLAMLPDVPTFAELGFKGFEASFYLGVVAPAGTPAAIVQRLSAELRRVILAPEFKARSVEAWALEPVGDAPADFAEFLRRDRDRAAERVKTAGVRLD